MSREAAKAWRVAGVSCLAEARRLGAEHPRGMANRLYYAAFSLTHALLIEAGQEPRPELGTWSHETLPRAVRGRLESGREVALVLQTARTVREIADYRPSIEVTAENVLGILRQLTRLFEAVR